LHLRQLNIHPSFIGISLLQGGHTFVCSLDSAIVVSLLFSLHLTIIIMARFSMLCLLQLLLVGSASAFMQSARPSFARPISSLEVAVDTASIKNGMTIEIDKEPYKVISFSIMKQARGAAKTTIKFKNLMRGTTIENTYRSGEKFETAMIEKKLAQFTFKEGVRTAVVLIVHDGRSYCRCCQRLRAS
jgi:hypothetical protein